MGTTTTTFALNKPTVGGDDNAWGSDLNANADKIDDLLDGTTAIKPNLSEGLWKVGGTAITATAAEINYIDGVTSAIQTQLDNKQALDADLTAIAGLSSNGLVARTGAGTAAARTVTAGTGITVTDGDGVAGNPTVAADLASQAEAQAGTDNTKLMTPLRTAQAITALASLADNAVTQAKMADAAVGRAELKTGTNSGSYSTGSGGGSGSITLDAYSFFPQHSTTGGAIDIVGGSTADTPTVRWSTAGTGSGTVRWRYILA